MNLENSYLQALLAQHAKPIFKQALQEWLSENQLTISSNKNADSDNLINTSDAAKLLGGIDRHTLHKLVADGKLAVIENVGKGHKFSKEDVHQFIKLNLKYKK